MKLTAKQLRKIIAEEVSKVIKEGYDDPDSFSAKVTLHVDDSFGDDFDSWFDLVERLAVDAGLSLKYVSPAQGSLDVVGESQQITDMLYDLYAELGYPWDEREVEEMLEPMD